MQGEGKMILEEPEEDQAYVADTSIPLRVLYQMLLDLYDNAYPIPFISFRKTFDKYMTVTKNNLIDSIVLLIYGAGKIKHIGTGEEMITVDRLKGEVNYPEDVKEVHSPFYRFIDGDEEVRIGYDYAVVIDFVDYDSDNGVMKMDEVIESDDKKDKVIPHFGMLIDPCDMVLSFEFPEGRHNVIDLKKYSFVSTMDGGKLYDTNGLREIKLQPVPKDCIGIKSYADDKERVFITELEDGKQFCYDTKYSRFDLISDCGSIIRTYVAGA